MDAAAQSLMVIRRQPAGIRPVVRWMRREQASDMIQQVIRHKVG
ncbi:hypothetical protein ABZ726_31385 [Streptomyces hundungensis]